jgi:hypothetical protein
MLSTPTTMMRRSKTTATLMSRMSKMPKLLLKLLSRATTARERERTRSPN